MAKNNPVRVHDEVTGPPQDGGWRLAFQRCTYTYDDGRQDQDGFRFIWRQPNGHLFAARGQARIPGAAQLFELLSLARHAGWLPDFPGK